MKKSKVIQHISVADSDFETKIDNRGLRWMICQNSESGGKYWKGKYCDNWSRVDNSAIAVLCWRCTAELVGMPEEKIAAPISDKPKGWKFMKIFVAKDGTVFYKGIEQPDLKGTLEPTVIEVKEPKKKLSKQEKETAKNELGKEIVKLKAEMFKETRKGKRTELKRALTKANRELKKLI